MDIANINFSMIHLKIRSTCKRLTAFEIYILIFKMVAEKYKMVAK